MCGFGKLAEFIKEQGINFSMFWKGFWGKNVHFVVRFVKPPGHDPGNDL